MTTISRTLQSLFAVVLTAVLSFGCGGWYDYPPEPQVPTSLDVPAGNLTPQMNPSDLAKRNDLTAQQSSREGRVVWIPTMGSVRIPLADLAPELARAFTLELWIKPRALDSRTIVSAGPGLRLVQQNGAIAAYVGGRWLRGTPMQQGKWQHVALVVDADQARLYLDGRAQDREFLATEWPRPSAALIVGRDGCGESSFEGFIDDLRLTSRALYDLPLFDPPPALVPMDGTLLGYTFTTELPGELVPDDLGRGSTASMLNGARLVTGEI